MTHFTATSLIPISLARVVAVAAGSPIATLAIFVSAEAGLVELLILNRVPITIFTMFTVAAAVSAMKEKPDGFYKWFYRFANIMTANIPREFMRAEKPAEE